MKRKDKGRKIYRTKEKNYYGKSPFQKFMSVILTVILIGGIGFLGYSIAEPIINFTKQKGDNPDEAIPAETTEQTEETTDNSTLQETDVNDSTAEIPTEAEEEKIVMEQYRAFALKETDLADDESLRTAIGKVPENQGIEYIEVPLKVSGGMIYYLSTVATYDVLKENQSLNLVKISETIKESGYKPTAVISTFRDNIFPAVDSTAGYTKTDGSVWYDTSLRPWISPFSPSALKYLTSIADEISTSGFERIVCSDFVFPEFTANDLKNLDEILGRTDRCMALTSAVNLLYDTVVSNGSSMFIEVSAVDILKGNTDILQPILLSVNTIVLNINTDELGDGISDGKNYYEFSGTTAEKVSKCIGFVSNKLSDFNVAVQVSGSSVTEQDLYEIEQTIAGCGYNSFVISINEQI